MARANALSNHKCDHSPCNCMVAPGERYCSDHCEDRSRAPVTDADIAGAPGGCGCGHAECTETSREGGG